ncbi:hypothetical protein [Christiangramia sp. LLG6405-1]|uniref:hypothetical protein n=1 Tax=Christiangramia sp. LLG6405-1 TaxID=3160832 RepID=UPI00386380CF
MKNLPQFIFLLFHTLFIGIAVYESQENLYQLIPLVMISSMLLYFYLHNFSKNKELVEKDIQISTIIFAILGGLATFALQDRFELSAVLSAGIVGLFGGILPKIIAKPLAKIASSAIYCGAFVGMTPPVLAGNYLFITLASIFAGFILILTRENFNGYGGKLGSIAFAGVSLVSLLTYMLL